MLENVVVGIGLLLIFAALAYKIVRFRKNHPILDPIEPTVLSVHEACLNWQPPPELTASPPRPVRVETRTLAFAVFSAFIILGIFYGMCYTVLLLKTHLRGTALNALALSPGLIVALLMVVAVQSSRRLLQYGQVTGALVTNVWNPLAGVPLEGRYGRTRYADASVRFAFLDQNRNLLRGKGKLPASAQPGQVVTVVFDPGRPDRNSLYPLEGVIASL
jgi:hypothetical protein